MQEILLIIVCLAIGVILRWSGRLPDTAGKTLGGWVINVALPSTALHSVYEVKLNGSWWLAAATPWLGALLSIAVIVPLCRAFGWSRHRAGALLLVSGWGNTSFVGLPMIAAFAGSQWLGLGIIIDLFGSYLALSTLGIAIATVAGTGHFDWRVVANKIATFPPFIAIVIALLLNDVARPDWLEQLFAALAATMTPIALAAVGYGLRIDRVAGRLAPLSFALVYRLALAPAVLILFYLMLGQAGDPVARVAMLEMAMPPMLGATIIAMDHELEPDLVALVIGIGIPLSMLTAMGWWSIIAGL